MHSFNIEDKVKGIVELNGDSMSKAQASLKISDEMATFKEAEVSQKNE